MRRLSAILTLLLALSLISPTAFAQEATPAAVPQMGECVGPDVPPGTPTPFEAQPAPEAEMEASPPMEATPVEEEEIAPVGTPEMPVGEPAPDDVVAEVEAAVQNFANCFNEGDFVTVAALYTEAGLRYDCGTSNIYDGPRCFGGPYRMSDVVVSDVQVHNDMMVSADVTYRNGPVSAHERFFFVVDEAGMYWLDVTPDLPPEIPDGATVIEGEMVDFEFVLDSTSAPAGDVAFQVTNTGTYPHVIVLLQLPDGTSAADVLEDESLLGHTRDFGGAFAEPGQEATLLTLDLQPGAYVLVCFVDVPEGVPHFMRGMILDFEVTAP